MNYLIGLFLFLGILLYNPQVLVAETKSSDNTIYRFKAKTIDGKEMRLSDFKNKVVLIVNVASKCGNTPQYKGLEDLYAKYKDKGFVILGFPCNQFGSQEPGTNKEIQEFCSKTYNVAFPMFEKIEVNGNNAHSLYKFLTAGKNGGSDEPIKWNFTKFLIDRRGNIVERFAPSFKPENITEKIKALLDK